MMRFIRLAMLVLFISVVNIAISPAANDGWKKVGEEDGIIGYSRSTIKSSVDETKAVGIADAPVAVVEAVIRDISSMPEYIFLCKDAYPINTPELKSAGDSLYFYSLTDLPFPVRDRDAVVKSVWSIDKTTGTVYCHTEGVKTSYKLSRNVVRMPLSIIDCTLIPEGKNKTRIVYQVLGDPGGELPPFVINLLTKDYGIKSIAGLRKMVKKDKYKNVQTVVTKTPRLDR